MRRLLIPVVLILLLSSACGYRVMRTPAAKGIKVRVAIPPVVNLTTRGDVSMAFTSALRHSWALRTGTVVVTESAKADWVLCCTVKQYGTVPIGMSEKGTAQYFQIQMVMDASLTERRTGRVLATFQDRLIREAFALSADPANAIPEEGHAVVRAAASFAEMMADAVVEN